MFLITFSYIETITTPSRQKFVQIAMWTSVAALYTIYTVCLIVIESWVFDLDTSFNNILISLHD